MLVTVSDKKIPVASTTNPDLIAYYTADVVTASDYYPFGQQMSGRKFSQANSSYRYGFNGKENDNDVKGEGNQQDYGMRIYDPRLGRFLSVDPIMKSYPELTPYQFASNRPIDGIDLDGLEYFKKDNTNYRMDYYPVANAGSVKQGALNVANNIGAAIWNNTLGAFAEGSKGLGNYFLAGGYKEPTNTNPKGLMGIYDEFAYDWDHGQVLNKLGNAATDLRTYELPVQLFLFHKFSASVAPGIPGVVESTTTAASKLTIPQGIMAEEFQVMSQRVVNTVGNISGDIVVQGSRAAGTATIASDIDIAIKMSAKEFDNAIVKAFGTPNKGSALERTMQHAIKTGKIQAGEAGLSGLRKNLEKLLGMKVDVSIIKKGGAFDNGAQIPVKGVKIP